MRESYRGYYIDLDVIHAINGDYVHVVIIHPSAYAHSYTGLRSLASFNHIVPNSRIADVDGARKKAHEIIDKHKPKKKV